MAKVALLIGVSEYEPGLNMLPASVKDVQAMAKVLQNPEMGGFAEADTQKLENPNSQTMQEAIEGLFSDRSKDDLVLLYFSGHGIKDESGKLYLATRLTRKSSQGRLVKATAVPANFIHNIMSDSRSKRQVVILDCCFSGAFAEGLSAKDDGSVNIHTQLGGEGRVVLTSSTSTQYSFQLEGDNLSIYTRYIVEGIETGAADQDNDGVISIDELHEYAKKKVQEAAPAMQPEIYAVKEGFKIRLAKAPIGDSKLRYRKEVELFASRGVISAIGRNTLDLKRQSLGLLPEEATIIETEVLKPYQEHQKRLHRYEQVLVEEISKEYPLDQNTHNDLTAFQQALGLKNEDIQPILARVAPKEIQPRNSPQRYIWNVINIGVIGVGILIVADVSYSIVNKIVYPEPSPSPTSSDTPTPTPTNTPLPSTPPSGTAPESWCLSLKEHSKNNSGEDNASIRALMKEGNCSYWGISLPISKSNNSSQRSSETATPPRQRDNNSQSTPPFGTAPESWCLSQKEHSKNNFGENNASIRALMKEGNCSYWGISLPISKSNNSSQRSSKTATPPRQRDNNSQSTPPFGTAPESWCLSQKEHSKNNFGENNASIRALMKESNCSYWGISLPISNSNNSSQRSSDTPTPISVPNNSSQQSSDTPTPIPTNIPPP